MEYISEKSACAGRGVSVAAVCALLAFGAAAEGATGVPVPTVPVEGAVIEPLTWGQQLARASDYTVPTTAAFSRYSTPIRLEWTGTTGPAEVSVCRASDGHCIWQCVSASGSCDVYNFYVGEEHVWTVRTDDASATGRFTVAQMAPRIIYTHNDGECFSNMRDEGGYRGLDGRRVRQGLIYRSCQFDSQSVGGKGGGVPRLDAVGMFDMTNRLGIKTDLDLRNDSETGGITTGSGLGPNVRWIHISGLYPKSVPGSGSPTGTMRKELEVLFDSANYPLVFHCKGGRDRTGALGFVALGLLGVSERDLYLDYAWTWEKPEAAHVGDWDALMAGMTDLAGDTTCEKLETLVRQCGFTDDDIAAYRAAMLEPIAEPPVHFHDAGLAQHVPASCSAEGCDVYVCTNAGCTVPPYALTNVLPMVAHGWGEWTTVTEPQLGAAGLRRRTCSACKGVEEASIDALKPPAEAVGDDWGYVVTQELEEDQLVTVTFTNTTSDWRWTLPNGVTSFDFLLAGGGGSGGVSRGGGGGAGGVVTGTVAVAEAGAALRAMVGAGGAAQAAEGDGADGQSSYLRLGDAELVAVYGGGGGGHYEADRISAGRAGGNGGGAGGNGIAETAPGGAAKAPHVGAAVTAVAAFGSAGGAGASCTVDYPGGGGGGGASVAGGSGGKGKGGGGGAGVTNALSGVETVYAGGGGAATAKSSTSPGGVGGGGAGGKVPTAGTDGLGGGGGGSRSAKYGASGAGGSGVVIIRYAVPGGGTTDPVVPGAEPRPYDTREAAEAARPSEVTPAPDVQEALKSNPTALAAYKACYEIETQPNGAGKWVNVAVVKSDVKQELQDQVDDGAAQIVSSLALGTATLSPVTSGFRYKLEYGTAPAALELRSTQIATDTSLSLEFPAASTGPSGFYRLKVTE